MSSETEIVRKKWLVSTNLWLYGLFSSFITGMASAILIQGGMAMGQTVDPSIKTLDLKQWMIAAVAAGIVGAAAYLKQSPLPKVPAGTEVTVESTKVTTTTVTPLDRMDKKPDPPNIGSTPGLP